MKIKREENVITFIADTGWEHKQLVDLHTKGFKIDGFEDGWDQAGGLRFKRSDDDWGT
jgi:hypothetical protein